MEGEPAIERGWSCVARLALPHATRVTRDRTRESVPESPCVFLLYRFVKVLAVAMALGGALGVFLPASLADARRSGLWIAVPGICLAWVMGFLLAHETGTSLLEMWIVLAMVLSFVAVQIVLFCVSREGRRGRVGFALCMATLVGTVALMVFRPTW